MTETELHILWDKYLAEELTEAEFRRFWAACHEPAHQQTWQVIMGEVWNNPALQHLSDEATGNRLLEQLRPALMQQVPQQAPVHFLKRYRWVAAAVLVLAMATGTWLWQKEQMTDDRVTDNRKKEILPGGNKATLTLADGSTIVLDSAVNGTLAEQNGIRIIKPANGQLSYKSDIRDQRSGMAYNILKTPRGGQYQVILPDGTVVWMNSASSLRYPTVFQGTERIVELSGEAYFEVAKNVRQPFRVKVNDLDVKVLGTNFNINAYPDEQDIQTTLVEGAVAVNMGTATALLQPGQQAQADKTEHTLLTRKANIKQVLSWKNGLFIFEDRNLAEVLREISRWYNIEIEYQAPVSTEHYGGVINRHSPLSKVLELLEKNGIQHFKIENQRIIVLP
jgi:ferric-dicitrate binding protein FerR (iron transport regulator)